MQAINVCPKCGRPMRSRRCFSCGYVIPKEEIPETEENKTGEQIKENVQSTSAPSSMPHASINSTERNASKLSNLKELSKRTVHRSQTDHPEQQNATASVQKNTAAVPNEVKRDPDEKPGLPKVAAPPKVKTVQQNNPPATPVSKKTVEPEKKDDDTIDTEALKKLIAGQSRFVKPKITKGLSGKPVTLNKAVPPTSKAAEDPVPKTLNRENEERLPENPPANKEESMAPLPENTAAPDMAQDILKEPDRSAKETIPEEVPDSSGDASEQGMNADEKKIYESYFVSKKLTNVKDPVKKEPEKKDSFLSGFMKKDRKKDEEQPEEEDEEEENIPDSIFNPNADHYYDDTVPDVISEPDRIKKSDIMRVIGSIFVVLLIIVMLILYI